MTKIRAAITALVEGVIFAIIIGAIDYFSSGLHVGHVAVAGVLFALAMYFFLRYNVRRSQ